MGVFKDIKEAKTPSGSGQVFLPGKFLLKLGACKLIESSVKRASTFFIAEFEVVESDNEKRKPGSSMSWVIDLTGGKYPDLSLGNVKNFLHVAYSSFMLQAGEEPPAEEDIDEKMSNDAVSEENPLCGVFVSAEAWNKQTRDKESEYTRVKWDVPENVAELAA